MGLSEREHVWRELVGRQTSEKRGYRGISNASLLITGSGRGNNSDLKFLLNISAMSRVSSRCCRWSSPTGTWVALKIKKSGLHRRDGLSCGLTCKQGYLQPAKLGT